MKLSLALAGLLASFAPAVNAECINILANSDFELGPVAPAQQPWFVGDLPTGNPFVGEDGDSCAVINDNANGDGIPQAVMDQFVAGGGALRNALFADFDLVGYISAQVSNTCRIGQVATLPDFDIESATFHFDYRSFSNNPTGGSGNQQASVICLQSPIAMPEDQEVFSTQGNNVQPGPESTTVDVTSLLQQAQDVGDEQVSVYLDTRSLSVGNYHASFWDNVELWVCPPGGGVNGDPHFKTWSGEWYDFHGVCDMVLVSNPDFAEGSGLDIHIRSKGRYEYSFIETAAIKIGEDILEVGSWGEYWFNGIESAALEEVKMGGKFEVTTGYVDKKITQTVIHLGGAESITIKTFKDMVNVNVEAPTAANFEGSLGMMGSFPEGKHIARDGATIMDDVLHFGQEWQVLDTESNLFVAPPTHLGVCAPPAAKNTRRLEESSVSKTEAEKACAHMKGDEFDMCVFDVMVTEDLEAANIHGAF